MPNQARYYDNHIYQIWIEYICTTNNFFTKFKIFGIYQDFIQDIQNTQDFKSRKNKNLKHDGK
jgi:hypothetical protein